MNKNSLLAAIALLMITQFVVFETNLSFLDDFIEEVSIETKLEENLEEKNDHHSLANHFLSFGGDALFKSEGFSFKLLSHLSQPIGELSSAAKWCKTFPSIFFSAG